ncbi:uncharacterized protein LOC113358557 [Papaver somniferum]|uniref:uncharacterized protein LOC113358557 n=1 Tax=Papaver somniferum TaxID=3469 RepID=UPI000E6FAA11|nr:uncharacterized protein LOC113358557 [Papaver somniferum]XP_026457941.1 uncharacterized protein LOC113358557 [Papaver somniferum]
MDESFQSCANLLDVTGGLRTNHILGTVVVYLTPMIRGMKREGVDEFPFYVHFVSWEKENISTESLKAARITCNNYMAKSTEKDVFHFRVRCWCICLIPNLHFDIQIVLLQLLVLRVVVSVSDVDRVQGFRCGGDSFDPWTKTKRKFSRSLSKESK